MCTKQMKYYSVQKVEFKEQGNFTYFSKYVQ